MTFTNYETQKKMVGHVINKKFPTFRKKFEEEMMQVGYLAIAETLAKPERYKITSGLLFKIIHSRILNFLKKETNYLSQTFSAYSEPVDSVYLIDTFRAQYCYEPQEFNAYVALKKSVDEVLDKFNAKGQQIIRMYLNRRSYDEIGKCFGMKRQSVYEYIQRFRDDVSKKIELDEVI